VSLTKAVSALCELVVNFRKLPSSAFCERTGPKGKFCRVDYDLGMRFGPAGIEFWFCYNGKVIDLVDAKYS
jgi:hypothetical protein